MQGLLVITQIAGILLLSSTMVLLFFLDAETKQPIKFNLPVLGYLFTVPPERQKCKRDAVGPRETTRKAE